MSIATVHGDLFEDGSVGLDIGIHTAHSPRLHVNHPLPDDREVYDAISLDGAAAHGFTSENVEVDVDQDIRQRQRQSIIPSTNPSERISTIRPVISPYSSSSATSKTSPPMMTITQSPPLPHSPPNPLSPHRRTIKGKERAWDLDIERGDERRFVEISRQEEKDDGLEVGKVYPPISDEEAEEKRIQEVSGIGRQEGHPVKEVKRHVQRMAGKGTAVSIILRQEDNLVSCSLGVYIFHLVNT